MLDTTPMDSGAGRQRSLDQPYGFYDHDQSLPGVLDRLNVRLGLAHRLYGPERSLSLVVSELHAKAVQFLELYGHGQPIEEMLDGIVGHIIAGRCAPSLAD
jgi:hypothetical protein